MFRLHLLVLYALLFCVQAHGAYRGRSLPYSNNSLSTTTIAISGIAAINSTSLALNSTSSSATVKWSTTSFGTGPRATGHNGLSEPTASPSAVQSASRWNTTTNDTATITAACTINVPNANINWWYAATYAFPTAKLFSIHGNYSRGSGYMSVIPNTERFDPASALSEVGWVEVLTYDPDWDVAWTYYEQYTVKPTAATTSVVSRLKHPAPTSDIIAQQDVFDLFSFQDPPPATIPIAVAQQTAFVATSATPVLYFSAYEIENAVSTIGSDGSISSITSTKTVELDVPYAYSYGLKGIESSATTTAALPSDFLQQIPESACEPGQLQAVITVLVVVDLYLQQAPLANPFIVHVESSVLGFEEPLPTRVNVLDTGSSRAPPITLEIPLVMHTADGFGTATNDDIMIPNGVQDRDPMFPSRPRELWER
ncbi:hypothetical protein BU24DRAFT_134530 [Aaosphaeria arxii CBS 175.79]|uniref:Uncharacterized protein n=1 Tax=Aaosphaeria arxii CBS 175.79 TaxID=1450172 RepID=A0A6A5Y3U8_9PLEO|nr:uncharacterized protein BU24DRAFT_134530 [Aaosphaeria arxii CBS 175.79]KAF2020158.1 hypothetical protein BU24DRAFT_134530 [Aaosphaeria arxii CBS 175.79]